MGPVLGLVVVLVLIALTAFFVAVEFAQKALGGPEINPIHPVLSIHPTPRSPRRCVVSCS